MFKGLLTRIAGDANRRELERLQSIVEEINSLEPELEGLSDEKLRLKTREFKERLRTGHSHDDLMVEAFAVVREAAKRTVHMRHFDVQLMGGIVLHQGKVAEMKTGEGKTLVATLPLYLNALQGKGAHLVTVNDYLARRDTQWMGPVYNFLGLNVGLLQKGGKAFLYDPSYEKGDFEHLRPIERKGAYLAGITYGTNNEFGFDYLRDNMAQELSQRVQRGLHYAIIDEADYILIDEARTPLIISGPSDEPLEEYRRFAQIAKELQPDIDYEVDLKDRIVTLTDQGLTKVEQELGLLNIYGEQNYKYVHYLEQALKARVLYKRDRDYIRQGQNIILIDEFTGRLMPHRRLSEGLHQAIEAKEGVRIKPRTMTYATITLQNFFRLYEKLAGMTGTAATAAEELYQIYGLDVVIIPTNEPMIRIDHPDVVYRTKEAKWKAIVREIDECHRAGRPVLVGTTSVEKSEGLSRKLKEKDILHQVLNAKNHAKEATIIAKAGEPGAVTVATKMAGRGVDIKLGGELSQETIKKAHEVLRRRGINPFKASEAQLDSTIAEVTPHYSLQREEVLELGGLHILGTERHEARRIDNQLRGRSGRQGDPGSSRFYLSLEDDLMRRFGGPNVANLMQRLGVEDDIPIEHNLVSKAIESAQNRIEGYNFDIRKHLLEYDDVLNSQRQTIYDQRYKILTKQDLGSDLWEMAREEIEDQISQADSPWELIDHLDRIAPLSFPPPDSPIRYPLLFANLTCLPPLSISFLAEMLEGLAPEALSPRLMEISREAFQEYSRHLLDRAVDERVKWAEEHYEEDLAAYTTRLKRLSKDFLSAQAGKERSYLLQGLQKSFPLRLDVRSAELNGLGADEMEELLAALEESYHRSVCEALIKTAEGRAPEALGLADFKPLDLPRQDLSELFEWAKKEAYDEEAEPLAKIEKRIEEGGYRDSLIQLLLDLNRLTFLDIEALGEVLRRILAKAYDRWAERQLKEIKAGICSNSEESKRPSTTEIEQLLLDVYYTERTFFDKDHKRRISPTPRIHLAFLAATSVRDKEPEQLRREILTHLKVLLKARENLWGEEALRTMSQQRLSDLGPKMYDGFAKFLGAGMVKDEERISDLNEDVQESICQYLGMRRLERSIWAELDPQLREGITEYLNKLLAEDMERRAIDLDEETRAEVKRYLLEEGYFDDEKRQRDLFRQKVNEVDRRIHEEIAQHWGRKLLMEMEEKPIAELEEANRQLILRCLRERGHFVDEEKLQHFLTHQRLINLGEETCRSVVQHLNQKHLKGLRGKRIGNLPLDVRRGAMGYLKKTGCFTDEDKKREFAWQKVRNLEAAIYRGLVHYLGRQQLGKLQKIADLKANLRAGLQQHLQEEGFLTDKKKVAAFPDMHLSDLGEALEKAQRFLLQRVKDKLDQHPIGQLDEELGESIVSYLKEIGYFAGEEKRCLFQQQPLAALEPNILHGLERHLGQGVMTEIGEKKFLNLDQETRQNVLKYFDEEGLFKRESERPRFIQQGKLSDLDREIYDGLAYYLGYRVLTEIKGLRFSQLPDEMGQAIWSYLEGHDYFADSEFVALVRESKVTALEPRVQETILSRLAQEIEEGFAKRKVADLRGYTRRGLRRYLEGTGYFVDKDRVRRIEQMKVTALDGEIREAVARYLGQFLLGKFEGQRIEDVEREVQESIWRYLDEMDYFLDEARKENYTQQRLSDLDPEIYSGLAQHLARRLEEEIKGKKVADLDDDFRQAIRAYLLSETGRFVSEVEVEEFKQQRLTDLEGDERQAVALSLGRRQLEEIGGRRLVDLEEKVQESVKHHLREQGYFFDQGKWQRFQQQRLSDLDDETRIGLMEHLRSKQAEALERSGIAGLGDEMRRRIRDYLRHSRLKGRLENQRLTDLEPELRNDLLRHLGYRQLEGSEGRKTATLDRELHQTLQRYFRRKMMHEVQKQVMLEAIDRLWVEYLTDIEDLRQGIGLEAFGRRDPLVEYKRKAYDMFQDLLVDIRKMVVGNIYRASPEPRQLVKA